MKRRSTIAEKAELKRQKQLQKQLEKEQKKAQAKQQKQAQTATAYRNKRTLVQRNNRAADKDKLTNTNTAAINLLLTDLQNAQSLLQTNQENLDNLTNILNGPSQENVHPENHHVNHHFAAVTPNNHENVPTPSPENVAENNENFVSPENVLLNPENQENVPTPSI